MTNKPETTYLKSHNCFCLALFFRPIILKALIASQATKQPQLPVKVRRVFRHTQLLQTQGRLPKVLHLGRLLKVLHLTALLMALIFLIMTSLPINFSPALRNQRKILLIHMAIVRLIRAMSWTPQLTVLALVMTTSLCASRKAVLMNQLVSPSLLS